MMRFDSFVKNKEENIDYIYNLGKHNQSSGKKYNGRTNTVDRLFMGTVL